LLKSIPFQAVVYYAAKTIYPDRLEGCDFSTPRKLSKLFKPDEFIALTTLTYFFKIMKRGCKPDPFQLLMKNIGPSWVIAAAIGRALPKIGFADALLFGTLPNLAHCLFLGVNRKQFKSYRVHLRIRKIPYDLAYEEEHWGCNCLQVAVLLAQNLGLGRHYHDPIMLGLGAIDLESVTENDSLYAARLLQIWIDSLLETGEPPDMPHRGEFYPFASETDRLMVLAQEITREKDATYFFQRGRDDISETLSPELFKINTEASDLTPMMEEELMSGPALTDTEITELAEIAAEVEKENFDPFEAETELTEVNS
ncbi:MAG: hypothetical protein KDD60_12115, partial [Bdellovibrionales bacterium]|nr:hypothetical protein [Bdellovibrionales bacterium]